MTQFPTIRKEKVDKTSNRPEFRAFGDGVARPRFVTRPPLRPGRLHA